MTTKQLRDLNAGQNKQASKVHVKLSDRINNSIGRFLVSSKVSKAFKTIQRSDGWFRSALLRHGFTRQATEHVKMV